MIYELVAKHVLSVDPQAVVRSLDGVIEITSSVVSSSVEEMMPELALIKLRMQRTAILAESDWMANSDVTMSDTWRDYRQALRDLPANSPNVALDEQGNLINVTWPTKPE